MQREHFPYVDARCFPLCWPLGRCIDRCTQFLLYKKQSEDAPELRCHCCISNAVYENKRVSTQVWVMHVDKVLSLASTQLEKPPTWCTNSTLFIFILELSASVFYMSVFFCLLIFFFTFSHGCHGLCVLLEKWRKLQGQAGFYNPFEVFFFFFFWIEVL